MNLAGACFRWIKIALVIALGVPLVGDRCRAFDEAAKVDRQSAIKSHKILPGGRLVFKDEFNTLSLWHKGQGGIWEPTYHWGARTNGKNGELQYYVDPRPGADHSVIADLSPYSVSHGLLSIAAKRIPPQFQGLVGGLKYTSGLITTHKSFACKYCLVAMRARLPRGRGLWPAFWLLPLRKPWPPEIDIMEVLGNDTKAIHVSIHAQPENQYIKTTKKVSVSDLADTFHEFAVNWGRDYVTWFIDGQEIAKAPSPRDLNHPMYILVNLAVGGWAKEPDGQTLFPAVMLIDWIRVYLPDTDEE